MAKNVKQVLTSKTPYSVSKYELKRSDGQLSMPKNPKPTTANDKAIHMGHIIDSGHYNLDHTHDHMEELAFDYKRLSKEKPVEAVKLQRLAVQVLNPMYKRIGLKLTKG